MKPRDPAKIEALYAAVLALNEEIGLRAATVPLLAARAAIGVGTFYVYFASKEALFKELYWKTKRESGESILGFPQTEAYRPHLRSLFRAYYLYRVANRRECRFLEAYYGSDFVDAETQVFQKAWAEPLHQMITRGQREELVVAGPPSLLLRCVLGILREGAAYAWDTGAGEQDADRVSDLALAAISR